MKNIIIVFLVMFSFSSFGQWNRGRIVTLTADTIEGNNNVNLGEIVTTGQDRSLYIQVTMNRISAAAGGTLFLKAGLDSAAVLVVNQATSPDISFAPNDTLATTNVATQYWNIEIPFPGAKEYHIWADGDANDTVATVIKYMLK